MPSSDGVFEREDEFVDGFVDGFIDGFVDEFVSVDEKRMGWERVFASWRT